MTERKRPSSFGNRTNDSSRGKTETRKRSWGIVFWVIFAIIIVYLFVSNGNTISRTLREAGFQGRQETNLTTSQPVLVLESTPETASPGLTAITPESSQGTLNNTQAILPGAASTPAVSTDGVPNESPAVIPQIPPSTVTFRERALYFINVDKDGTIIRTRVNRNLPVSDSPLTDVLGALIAGPSPEEQRLGLISLIPEETRIMNAMVRGNTAYISFSEDFQYNVYGIEGYAGAVRQVVWTATEFPNVHDVQILIESRRLDYLGEGVWIGSPLSRTML